MAVANTLSVVINARDDASVTIKSIESSIIRMVGSITAGFAALQAIAFPVTGAANMQTALLNVAKTTEFTNDQLTVLRQGFIRISQSMDVAAIDLAKIAAAGGQLGLGREGVAGLLAFTETTARFASVLNVSAEEAGNAIAKLVNIFGVSIRESERINSLLNEISNNSTANGAELIDMMQRIGTAGGTVGIKQSAALAAVGRDVGLTVETVGTSFNKIFLDLQTKAPDIAAALNVPVEAWAAKVRTDGIGALKDYLAFLATLPASQAAAFAEKTTGGGRIFALVTNLVNDAKNGFTLLNRHLAEADKGFDQGTSAIKEQERVLLGLQAQFQILKNVASNAFETIGRRALPFLTDLVSRLQAWAQSPAVVNAANAIAEGFGRIAAAAVTLLGYLSPVIGALTQLLPLFQALSVLKIASVFANMISSTARATAGVLDHAKAWAQVLTFNRAALNQAKATSLAQSGAVGPVPQGTANAVLPLVTRVGAAAAGMQQLFDRAKALNATLLSQASAYQQLTTRIADYNARIANATSPQQRGGLTAARNKVEAQRSTLVTNTQGLIQQAGLLGRLTNAYTAVQTVMGTSAPLTQRLSVAFSTLSGTLLSGTTSTFTFAGALRGLGTAASLAGTAVLGLGRVVAGLVTVLGSIVSAVAVVATVLSVFGLLDPLIQGFKRLFGLSTESGEARARAAAEATEALRAEEAAIRATADGYSRMKAELAGATGSDRQAKLLQFGAVADAKAKQLNIDYQLNFIGEANLKTKLEGIKKEIEAVSAEITIKTKDAADSDTPLTDSQDITALQTRLAALTQQATVYEQAIDSAARTTAKLATDKALVTKEQTNVALEVASSYDAEGFAIVELIAKQAQLRESMQALRKAKDTLEQRGAASSTDATQVEDFNVARGRLDAAEQEYAAFSANVSAALAKASVGAVDFVASLVPNPDAINSSALIAQIATIGQAMGTTSSTVAAYYDEISQKAAAALAQAAALRAEASKATSESSKSSLTGQASEAERTAAVYRGIADSIRAAQAAATAMGPAIQANMVEPAERSRRIASQAIAAYAAIGPLRAQEKQWQAIAKATAVAAQTAKTAYERVFVDIQRQAESSAAAIADIHRTIATRGSAVTLKGVDQQSAIDTRKFNEALKDQEHRLRASAIARGISTDQYERERAAMQANMEAQRQSFADEQSVIKGKAEVDAKIRERVYLEGQLNANLARQQALQQQLKDAQAAGDPNAMARIGIELGRSVDSGSKSFEDLQRNITETAAMMARMTQGNIQDRTLRPVFDDTQIRAGGQLIEEYDRKLAAAQARSREVAAEGTAVADVKANQKTQEITTEIARLETTINQFRTNMVRAFGDAGAAMVNSLAGLAGSSEALQQLERSATSLSRIDLRTGLSLGNVGDLTNQIDEINRKAKELGENLSVKFNIAGGVAEWQQAMSGATVTVSNLSTDSAAAKLASALSAAPVALTNVTAPNVAGNVQQALGANKYAIDIIGRVAFSTGGPVRSPATIPTIGIRGATGGHVRGAGTSRSDDIFAMLSHGEYVMDSATVRMFGSGFFRYLQTIANFMPGAGGVKSLLMAATVPIQKKLPGFKTGGPIGSSNASPLAGLFPALASPAGDKTELTINIGGGAYQVEGGREQVRGLVNALRMLDR